MCTSLHTYFGIIVSIVGQVFQSVSTQGSQPACGEALSQHGEPACRQPLAVWGVSSRHGVGVTSRGLVPPAQQRCAAVLRLLWLDLGGESSECVGA